MVVRTSTTAIWRQIIARAAEDPAFLVREEGIGALDIIEGASMASTRGTLSTLYRVLFLRRVELFASLDPDDLQTIAALATEAVFTSGERIYADGDPGDEMLIVVRGKVRLTKDSEGEHHLVGEYGEGEHVGELAVLRAAPRSADVDASSDDVRVLVIRGDQLRQLLADRPRVAQAMLASLAERLATLIEDGPSDRPTAGRLAPSYSAAYTGASGKKLAQANQNSLRCRTVASCSPARGPSTA